jgi:hypothetical protein
VSRARRRRARSPPPRALAVAARRLGGLARNGFEGVGNPTTSKPFAFPRELPRARCRLAAASPHAQADQNDFELV